MIKYFTKILKNQSKLFVFETSQKTHPAHWGKVLWKRKSAF